MPELPEVETMCRGLAVAIGKRIADVEQPSCHCKPIVMRPRPTIMRRRLQGATIDRVYRLGKRVMIDAGQHVLAIQPRMTGLVCLDAAPDEDYVRLKLHLQGGPPHSICFWDRRGLGVVELLARSAAVELTHDRGIGPDALSIEAEMFVQRLSATSRPIKAALMDQRLLAGIGNLYASEILFVAKVHPAQPADTLKPAQWQAIYNAMRQVLEEAIRYEGSTLSDGTYRNALSRPGRYQNHHRVYARTGGRCRRCQRGIIRRIVQAQRSTFFCPCCQRLPRTARRKHASGKNNASRR